MPFACIVCLKPRTTSGDDGWDMFKSTIDGKGFWVVCPEHRAPPDYQEE